MKSTPARLLLPLALPALLLTGCSLLSRRDVVLWTNRPEMAAYVEHFNARQDSYRIKLVYRELPARSWEEGGRPPDLLVDSWLNTPARISRLQPVEDLLRGKRVPREAFYAQLLERGALDNKQILLPVSFDLPAVIYRAANLAADAPSLALPLDTIRDRSAAFNRMQGNRFDRMGFSPRWDTDFLYLITSLFGVSFRQAGPADVRWNEDALGEAIQYTRQWVRDVNKGLDADRQFSDRYLYNPMEQLLATNRVLFWMSTTAQVYPLLVSGKENLNFRWISHRGKVAVQEDVLWAGIPRRARNVRGAKYFLEWFLQPQTHALILKMNHNKRMKVFGVCSGFSALREVTESAFPQVYPWLIGHIPTEDLLQFPTPPPDRWAELKRRVVVPWLGASLAQDQPPQNLSEGVRKLYSEKSIELEENEALN